MGKYKKSPVVLFILVLLGLYIIIYIMPKVTGVLQASYTAKFGELRISDKTEGYFVRNEYVYFSTLMGEENRYIENNKLVRKGTRIMEIAVKKGKKKSDSGTGTYDRVRKNVRGKRHIKTDDFVAQQEGIVSYNVDGFESSLNPDNMGKKDKTYFSLISNNDNIDLKRKGVLSSDPVFKICDRSAWYLICYVPKESKVRYKRGSKVTVEIDGKKEIIGKIISVSKERREIKLIIKTDYYYEGFTTTRKADIEVITSNSMGLIISNTSIVEKNGRKGVYVRQKTGKYKFKPISILSTDGKKSVIVATRFRNSKGDSISTVRSYDDVLRRPAGNGK